MTVRAVLFDAVGTLIFPQPEAAEVYHRVGRRFGSLLTLAEIRQRFESELKQALADDSPQLGTSEAAERRRWERVVRAVLCDLASPAIDGAFAELWGHFAAGENWRLAADAEETLTALRERGLVVGLASNFDARLHDVWGALDRPGQVGRIFCSSELGASKPQAAFFRGIEQRLDLAPDALLLVGDDLEQDFRGALAAGWQALLLDPKGRYPGEPSIRSLSEVAARC